MNEEHIDMPHRKQMRLKGYNYSQAGCYFVTLCTLHRRVTLGRIVEGDLSVASSVVLSWIGEIVETYINNIYIKYKNINIDKYVIMPNHIHMIIVLQSGVIEASTPSNATIPKVIRSLKTLVTKEVGTPIFQESFYDHVIRNEADYLAIWNYIDTNPIEWADDEYNQL